MVFVEDSGSVFDAQLDMVWKLGEAHIKEGNRIHPNTRNNKSGILNEILLSIAGSKSMMLTVKILE
jgi:hypothetical protein